MRAHFVGAMAIGAVSGCMLVACGESASTTGAGAGDVGGQGTTTSSAGGGGGDGCKVLSVGKLRSYGATNLELPIVSPLGSANEDYISISFTANAATTTWSGTVDLETQENANYSTCTTCLLVTQDDPDLETDPDEVLYFQTAGQLDLGSTIIDSASFDPAVITDGSLTVARFAEVTIDPNTYVSTPIPGGRCLVLVSASLAMTPAPVGWTCGPSLYDDDYECNCGCGVVDEDCSDPAVPMTYPCEEGQSCDATTATCQGIPLAWTCPDAEYAGGPSNGCDCGCGTRDPDCDLVPAEPIDNCAAGDTCNVWNGCVPAAWTCESQNYEDALDICDCGCGVPDPDCPSPDKSSCLYCDLPGSCDTVPCSDAASTIDPTNNAVCN